MKLGDCATLGTVAARLFLTFAAAAVLSGCGSGGGQAEASIPAAKRTYFLTAMEFKGSTESSKEAFPTAKLPAGGGLVLKAPTGDPPKWEAEAYAWSPGTLVAAEGDEIALQLFGVNGAQHDTVIEGHEQSVVVKRGQLSTLNFKAGKPGIYAIVCKTHQPSMTASLVVLPKSK